MKLNRRQQRELKEAEENLKHLFYLDMKEYLRKKYAPKVEVEKEEENSGEDKIC
jgi:hypothetical protein